MMYDSECMNDTLLCMRHCDDNLHTVTAVTAYPSQVNHSRIHVEFSEDTRNGFFGYAVANLSWEAPPGTIMK